VLAIAQTRGPGELNTILALSALSVPACARISRIATIRLKSRPFITAARLAGTGGFRILASHVGPNIAPQLAGFALLGIGISMTLEGALSYLGLGVPIPEASWGGMIRHGQEGLLLRPDLVLIPAAALFTVVLCANWLGTALRERWS
jgi:peptide/nickel transport system permease protein